jgi:hypothetical protein
MWDQPPCAFVPSAVTRHVKVDIAQSGHCCSASLTTVSNSIDFLPFPKIPGVITPLRRVIALSFLIYQNICRAM